MCVCVCVCVCGSCFISDRHRAVIGPICLHPDQLRIFIRYRHAHWEGSFLLVYFNCQLNLLNVDQFTEEDSNNKCSNSISDSSSIVSISDNNVFYVYMYIRHNLLMFCVYYLLWVPTRPSILATIT